MALPARLDERERRAILRARMKEWSWEDEKRLKSRRREARRRAAALQQSA